MDNIIAITFADVRVKNSSKDTPRISGTILVDYTSGKVTGHLIAVGYTGINYYFDQFQAVTPPPGSDFSITSSSALGTGTLSFSYSSQQPPSLKTINLNLVSGDFTTFVSNHNQLSEQIVNVNSNNLAYSSTASGFNHFIDLYNFEASYPDLIASFGLNQQEMQNWYNTREPIEQRIETFDGLDYVASYPTLIKQFASAESMPVIQDDGAKQYITTGFAEGNITTFNGLDYIASYPDLIKALGTNNDAGAYHYIENGNKEGRTTTFDGLDYIASYTDLIAAFGANEQAGAAHFITNGFNEGRTTTFDGLSYIADYTDLMNAFGANNDAGASHYITNGFHEGRSNQFTFQDSHGTFSGGAAVTEYEKDFPKGTAQYGNNDDAFFTAYIDFYKTNHTFLGQG